MGKYFNVRFKPDIVNGDISPIIASNKTDNPFQNGDVLFDWHTLELPQACKLASVTCVVNGEDGAAQANENIELIFARAIDGVAPTTLGLVNGTASSLNLQHHVIGTVTMDKDKGAFGIDSCFILSSAVGSADGGHAAIVLEGEHSTTTGYKTGYQTIYVAAIARGAYDFSTGVLANAAVSDDTAATATTGIVVKTVDARLVFSPGDTVYIHDVDTAIGVVKSVTDNDIILKSANVGAIAENDEVINANPLKFTLHCEM